MDSEKIDYSYRLRWKGSIQAEVDYPQRYAVIHDLKINWLFRRCGYGTDLMNKALDYCYKLGLTKVYLGVKSDSWQYYWYRRLGFRYDGDDNRPGYIRMIKFL